MSGPERWRRIDRLFEGALARPPAERRSFLAAECGEEGELAAEVTAMLDAHERAGGILDRDPDDLAAAALAAAPRTEAAPVSAGPYRILREIGRGGMGVVYQAWDDRLRRPLAVKFLPPWLRADGAVRRRFLDEARAASALEHPAICTIYDLGETDDGRPFIAMAFYAGRTLEERIAGGPVPVESAVDWVLQVARGLARAHEAGIVHRDVKPANLLLTDEGQVKILDFGVARLAAGAGATAPGSRLGTPAYMAPEQARGEPVDGRADLFSLGAVLYELLTGVRPFGSRQGAAAGRAGAGGEPAPAGSRRPEVPPALDRLIARCLAEDLDERPASAAELVARLELSLGASGGTAGADLPAAPTRFVGREAEIRQVVESLREARLVTLTGPGGTGKTRLAVEAARAAEKEVERIAGATWFVSLADVRDPERVAPTIASALGVAESAARTAVDALRAALRDRRCLLVLDNLEQVVAAAPALADLLAHCRDLRILATSRVLLRLSGERVVQVPPLEMPDPATAATVADLERHAATALFLARARESAPGFALADDEAPLVARLCRRLDGLPLAIELAAARVRHFDPADLVARLDRRLDLLSGGPRDAPDRHQTLRRAVAWSYDLLAEPERALFRSLAVFAGGFTAEAAGAVAAPAVGAGIDVADGLAALLDHSLLQRDPRRDRATRGRFRMLDTLREFARGRLRDEGDEETAHRSLAVHLLSLAERADRHLTGPEQERWLDMLAADHGNLEVALDRAEAAGEAETGLRLGAALWRYWLIRGHLREGRGRLERLVAMPDARLHTGPLARALHGLGTLLSNLGDNRAALRVLEAGLERAREVDDHSGLATLLGSLAWQAMEVTELGRGKALSEEALRLHRRLGDRRGEALALNNLGWAAIYEADYRRAEEVFSRSLDLRREVGDRRGVAFALSNLAWAEERTGRFDRAAERLREAEEIFGELGDRILPGWTLNIQGLVAAGRGDRDEAAAVLTRAAEVWREAGNPSGLGFALNALGEVLVDLGRTAGAEAAADEAGEMAQRVGTPWGAAGVDRLRARLARAAGDLGEAAARGRASFAAFHRIGDRREAAESLAVLAAVEAGRRRWRQAGLLLGAAVARCAALGAPPPREATAAGWTDGEEAAERELADGREAGHSRPFDEVAAQVLDRQATASTPPPGG